MTPVCWAGVAPVDSQHRQRFVCPAGQHRVTADALLRLERDPSVELAGGVAVPCDAGPLRTAHTGL